MRFASRLPTLCLLVACLAASAAEAIDVLDFQGMRVVAVDGSAAPAAQLGAELVIVGGGLGGVAAALAACEAGLGVILTEECSWLGGQFTSQGLPVPDENYWIEKGGCSRGYRELRRLIRDHYRGDPALLPELAGSPELNPGDCWASGLSCEPTVALAAIEALLARHIRSGRLRVLPRHKCFRAESVAGRILSVDLLDLEGGAVVRARGALFLDATELGGLLPLVGAAYVTGAESRASTREPGARESAEPSCSQAFCYPFALEFREGESHLIGEPTDYLSGRYSPPGEAATLGLFDKLPGEPGSLWAYRRIVAGGAFADGRGDVSLINWPLIDFREGEIIDMPPALVLPMLLAAKALSLGFLYWMQTEMPHGDGAGGWPGLRLRPDLMGTDDGLAMHPYIRESRRIVALETVREQEIARRLLPGRLRALFFRSSVGIGHYGLDIHPGGCADEALLGETRPFQIPLGALIPVASENLLAAAKNIGTTHITNGAYRVHHVEWAVGEAAGTLAATCVQNGISPGDLHANPDAVIALQRVLVERGVPIYWYSDMQPGDPEFAAAQMAPFLSDEKLAELEARSSFHPQGSITKRVWPGPEEDSGR